MNKKYAIYCYKLTDVKDVLESGWTHDYKPSTLEEALKIGHELTRDYVCDAFRVSEVKE